MEVFVGRVCLDVENVIEAGPVRCRYVKAGTIVQLAVVVDTVRLASEDCLDLLVGSSRDDELEESSVLRTPDLHHVVLSCKLHGNVHCPVVTREGPRVNILEELPQLAVSFICVLGRMPRSVLHTANDNKETHVVEFVVGTIFGHPV